MGKRITANDVAETLGIRRIDVYKAYNPSIQMKESRRAIILQRARSMGYLPRSEQPKKVASQKEFPCSRCKTGIYIRKTRLPKVILCPDCKAAEKEPLKAPKKYTCLTCQEVIELPTSYRGRLPSKCPKCIEAISELRSQGFRLDKDRYTLPSILHDEERIESLKNRIH